eukprot:COSAG01_NODE_4109_length_5340_cov_3.390574_1_plen_155_part_10
MGLLMADGTFALRFADGCGVLLEPAASAYTFVDRRGVSSAHRCAYAMGGHLDRLQQALDLHNSCVDRPFLCSALEDRLRSPAVFQVGPIARLPHTIVTTAPPPPPPPPPPLCCHGVTPPGPSDVGVGVHARRRRRRRCASHAGSRTRGRALCCRT